MAARGGRRKVAGLGELADLQMRSARPADPEFALMASEKVAAAAGAAESCLQPFGQRVRANVKRLGRQG